MAINNELLRHLEKELNATISKAGPVGGGSISHVYCLHTAKEKYLLKLNNKGAFPGMFKAEAEGLDIIKSTNSIHVPTVILQDNFESDSLLVLEWIETKRPNPQSSALLGEELAQMHRNTSANFGEVADNYMGSLKQGNRSHPTWAAFFIEERLKPMVELAINKHLINNTYIQNFEKLYKQLPGLFQEEPPSLIHGDLWSGNYLISVDNNPYLIDPAVSYGHREFDIAMTTLFGGFSNEFYEAYNHHSPLAKGWQQRLDLWNLYPLLVHLNLFGSGYLAQVRDCLTQFI
ncbi:fructosamine kinase family protein [Mucilaginibacter sp. BT774]|uniref:fructosamine kinase family protein n=1 Tax=Mucilaginibacter sp. BT774 TaxID=3062276 RepID=UPI00267755F9|nr:fructosamine kinase family protein [Mucilaginibacter sp. BT774]MDO3625140.1 fructosamine kinase family protein [Mucilaginibacter sp. BT774]